MGRFTFSLRRNIGEDMEDIKQNKLYIVFFAVCAVSFLFVVYSLMHHIQYKNWVIQDAKKAVQSEADRIAVDINKNFLDISISLDAIAKDYEAGKLKDQEVVKKLEKFSKGNSNIIKSGVIFTPSAGEENTGYKPFFYERKDSKMQPLQVASSPDYLNEPWYIRSMAGKAGWEEPFFDEAARNGTVTFSTPIYKKDAAGKKASAGVLYINTSLDWLARKMESLKLEKNDFGIILSGKGTILYHPLSHIVLGHSTIFDVLAANKTNTGNHENQRQIMQKAVNGESGSGYITTRNGQSFWCFYRPIPSTGWSLVVNFMKEAVPINSKALRRQQICLALGLIIFLTSLAAIRLRLYSIHISKVHRLWWIAIIFSILCIMAACFTWYLTLATPFSEYQQNKIVIDDPVSLNRFLASSSKLSQELYGSAPVYIPTGIYIQSIDFSSSNNIAISGYIWQRYAKTSQGSLPRGFIMPECKTMTVSESYHLDAGEEEVIGWYFEALIQQSFDYSKYPFDHPNIAIWLRHKDFIHNIILVPDLKAYQFMNIIAHPGLQTRLTLPGYAFKGTFFSYDPRMINTNFGLASIKREARAPELFYNIIIRRNFITPLVSKIFPILIVISMLFIVILSFSTDAVKQKNFGLSGLAVVALIISFFFTTLLAQVDLRQQFRSDSIMFIENFNFITYLILLLSTFQAFLFSAEKKLWFVRYEHCLIPKLLYWPIFSSLVLAVSLVYFF